MSDYKFNRQDIIGKDDIREIMDIISTTESHWGDFDGRYNDRISTLVNQLFGLFDGVLYGDLVHNANMAMLPTALVGRIHKISTMVSNYMLAEGGEKVEQHSFDSVWIP